MVDCPASVVAPEKPMRAALLVTALILPALFAGSAQASIGYSCSAKDATVRLSIAGAYGTSLGSGVANFGGDIEILGATVPDRLRRVWFDLDHLGQNWFYHRDIKLVAVWRSSEEDPFAEVILVVETRRGDAEESPYTGTYRLLVDAAPVEDQVEEFRFEASGTAICMLN
jgi:hypothetical protein